MPTIEVQAGQTAYQVRIKEGTSEKVCQVRVPEDFYQKLTGGKVSKEECLKASFRFLLEREPKESILSQFDLPVIGRYFPEFEGEFEKYISSKS